MFQSTSSKNGLQIKVGAKQKLFLVPAAALALFALNFVALPYITASLKASASGTATTQITAQVTEAWASLVTSGDISMNAGAVSGDTVIVADALAVARTNSPAGYQLYLTGSNGTSGNGSALVNTGNSSVMINSASVSTPTALSGNQWGYAVTGEHAKTTGFASAYSTGKFTSGSADFSKTFKGIVSSGSTNPNGISSVAEGNRPNALIASSTSANVYGTRTNIYYAAKVTPSTPSGTYSNQVTYTLVADCNANVNPTVPDIKPIDPSYDSSKDNLAYVSNGTVYYYLQDGQPRTEPGHRVYYHDNSNGGAVVTAYGVNKTVGEVDPAAKVANISDGNITWAAIAVVAGASATFLAIALLRDREDEDEEEI